MNFRNSLNKNYNFGGLRFANKIIRTRGYSQMLDTSHEICKTEEQNETEINRSFFYRTKRYILDSLSFYGENRDDIFLQAGGESIYTIPYKTLDKTIK